MNERYDYINYDELVVGGLRSEKRGEESTFLRQCKWFAHLFLGVSTIPYWVVGYKICDNIWKSKVERQDSNESPRNFTIAEHLGGFFGMATMPFQLAYHYQKTSQGNYGPIALLVISNIAILSIPYLYNHTTSPNLESKLS